MAIVLTLRINHRFIKERTSDYLHQGGRYDATTGLYSFRNRDYNPDTQRWMQQDPLGYIDGVNRYQYAQSSPNNWVDPAGTQSTATSAQPVTAGGVVYVNNTAAGLNAQNQANYQGWDPNSSGGYDPNSSFRPWFPSASPSTSVPYAPPGYYYYNGPMMYPAGAQPKASDRWFNNETGKPWSEDPKNNPGARPPQTQPGPATQPTTLPAAPTPGERQTQPGPYAQDKDPGSDPAPDQPEAPADEPQEQEKPERVTNPKHNPNSSSPEPSNVDELFKKSIEDPNTGVRWAKDANGVIHRFSAPSNGQTHWNGSTDGNKPIRQDDIPIRIRRELDK